MKHTKNIAAALLALLAASSVMTACGGSGDTGAGVVTDAVTGGADSTVETSADTAELTDLQIRQSIPDNLPEVDYGGREFRIACSEEYNFHNEFWVEEQNGDQCNDAVYQRNEKIESRFNTKISIVSQGATDREATPKFLNKIAMAGDDAADALWFKVSLNQEANDTENRTEIWNLNLVNEEFKIQVGAKIEIVHSGHKLLDKKQYRIVENNGLAADHGCLVTQALLYLKEKLERQ